MLSADFKNFRLQLGNNLMQVMIDTGTIEHTRVQDTSTNRLDPLDSLPTVA